MCVLFDTIRPQQYDQDVSRAAATALLDLGYLAERTRNRLRGNLAMREHLAGRYADQIRTTEVPSALSRQGPSATIAPSFTQVLGGRPVVQGQQA